MTPLPERSPIDPFLANDGTLLLDGGLATELEARGHVLDTALWSAELLLSDPDAIRDVHLAYLEAGADCIITSSYQASIAGLSDAGLPRDEAVEVLKRSVDLALEARAMYLRVKHRSTDERPAPLVAASIGPYGASLADGSEYTGDYGISNNALHEFHLERWERLAQTSVDLFACETIPSANEAEVFRTLLERAPSLFAWMSFSCRDGERISDGTPLAECAAMFDDCEQVVAVGINCTAPRHVSSLIECVRKGAPRKPVIVYPNSGEVWDGKRRVWIGMSEPSACAHASREWRELGARLIGGCCRVGPEHIRAMRQTL